MKRIFLAGLCMVVFMGCATNLPKNAQAKNYEASIMIGQKKHDVIKAAEKVFGEPKQIGDVFADSDYTVEVRRYDFTNVSDFVMYFHDSVFIQAGLMPIESPEYPPLRADYQSITMDKPGPVLGYTIFMNDEEVILDTIQP